MNEILTLDKRLETIAKYVQKDAVVADIGTDHAYLTAHLVLTGKIKKAYACDINELPIENAKKTVKKYNLQNKIHCVLTDGLNGLNLTEIDQIIIAGMGGGTIISILEACQKDLTGKKFILQPMTKFEKLREYLCNNGYEILEENPVVSGRFVYTLLVCEKNNKQRNFEPAYKFLGEMPRSNSPDRDRFLRRIYINISRRIEGLEKTSGHEEEKKIYKEVIKKIEEVWR